MGIGAKLIAIIKSVSRACASLITRPPTAPRARLTREAIQEEERRRALAELERLKNQMPEN